MQAVYIEVSDEITTVIQRMKEAGDVDVALVVPRGAILLQSIVNLKLIKKAAQNAGKEITLITTDKIGKNLATQLGIPVFARISDDASPITEEGDTETTDEAHVIAGVKIHRYYEQDEALSEEMGERAVEPIIPKQLLKEKLASEPLVVEAPITVREIAPNLPPVPAVAAGTPVVSIVNPTKSVKTVSPVITPPKTKLVTPASRSRRLLGFSVLYTLILVLLLATGAGAYYLPKTEAVITIPAETWNKTLSLIASTDAKTTSVDNQTIPAEEVSGDATATLTFVATGKKDAGQKATGSAKLINDYSTNPQTIPAGSEISAGGVIFTTDSTVTVPGFTAPVGDKIPGEVTVPITAVLAGDNANMTNQPGTITTPATKVYAKILSTSGGSSKTINVITQADVSGAKNTLTKQLQDACLAKITDALKTRTVFEYPTLDSFSLDNFTVSALTGAEVDNAKVSAKGTTKRLVVDQGVARIAAGKQITTPPNSTTIIDSINLEKTPGKESPGPQFLTATVKGKTSQLVQTEPIRKQLVGKSREVGLSLLSNAGKNAKVSLKQTPSWWPLKNFPLSNRFISVTTKYE
jgi:hypothetical protein